MKTMITLALLVIMTNALTACYTAAVAAAGAGGGYVVANERDKKDGDRD